jgi:ABC-2 type transport system ATP-binding protein
MSLQVNQLCKTFRDKMTLQKRQVLFDVTFKVPEQSITGFLGSNGAGKTTTMKTLLGLLQKDRGEISFFNNKYEDFRTHIGYMPERPYFYEYLTGMEFLAFYGQLSIKKPRKEIRKKADALLDKVGLSHAKDKLLRNYSKGMLQRVGLAQAIIHDPKFLILDEPMSGLDPDGRYQITELIKELGQNGTTLFFSSHLLDDVEKLCDRLVIIDRGQILYEGSKQDFMKSGRIGYEVVYIPKNQAQAVKKNVTDVGAVQSLLGTIQSEGGTLVSVREPRVTLEEAFSQLKREKSVT